MIGDSQLNLSVYCSARRRFMTNTERLAIWNTPFSERTFPSVSLRHGDSTSNYVITVRSDKMYEVQCSSVVSVRVTDESFFPLDPINEIPRDTSSCTYLWQNSRWVREFDCSCDMIHQAFGKNSLIHYILLGGDYNIEFLAAEVPEIVEIST